jgi:hypothetical protein
MWRGTEHHFRCLSWISLAIVLALVVVPTVLRAQQRIELRDTTRLSIRLNWQSDAPPRMADVAPSNDGEGAVVPTALAAQPHPARVVPRVHVFSEPVVYPPLDNSPDPLRGPPILV